MSSVRILALMVLTMALLSPKTISVAAQEDVRERIKVLWELMGVNELLSQINLQQVGHLEGLLAQAGVEFEADAMNELEVVMSNSLQDTEPIVIERSIDIWSKYLSIEDINSMIEFYESPIGQKILTVNPLITQESMDLSMEIQKEYVLPSIIKAICINAIEKKNKTFPPGNLCYKYQAK